LSDPPRALTEGEAEAHAQDLAGWTLDFPKLRWVDTRPDFRAALAWINRVGMLAEEEGHHPDFHLTGWNRVELVLWTHSVEGLSAYDFVLARKISALADM
jgi:4a-hydroxytetrahydrobiopterin dehydratase